MRKALKRISSLFTRHSQRAGLLRTGIVPKDELTLEFRLERQTSRAERVRTSTRYQNRE